MSRASGAGAYSQGMACPSPNPQLLGRASGAATTLVSVRSGMDGIMSPPVREPLFGPLFGTRSAVVRRERIDALAEADVDMVVMAGVPAGQPFADQHRVVEVDDLDVTRRGGPDGADERAGRAAVVDGHPVVAAPLTLTVVATHDP